MWCVQNDKHRPPQSQRLTAKNWMNCAGRTSCCCGGSHLFNWNVFIPLYVFHVEKASVWSNGAAQHCWYIIFIDVIYAVGTVNLGCSKDRKIAYFKYCRISSPWNCCNCVWAKNNNMLSVLNWRQEMANNNKIFYDFDKLARMQRNHTIRVQHGYGKMGSVGMSTVVDFGTLWHATYLYHGITGTYRYITIRVSLIFPVLKLVFFLFYHFFLSKFMVSHMTKPNMAHKAEHECTHGWPRSIPTGISNSKCYTWICVGFSHQATWSCGPKTHGFSSTGGSTCTWKYLQVLRILNSNLPFFLIFFQHLFIKFIVWHSDGT